MAKEVAAMGGAKFVAILQPVAPLGSPNIEYMRPKGPNTEFHRVYPYVKEIKDREGLDWIHDLTDTFDVKEYIYIDSCHVNGLGNKMMAERIGKLLAHHPEGH